MFCPYCGISMKEVWKPQQPSELNYYRCVICHKVWEFKKLEDDRQIIVECEDDMVFEN